MKNFKSKILILLGISTQRTKNISRHIGLSLIYKGGSILANFLLVPLTIDYLDTEKYGIWLIITSFISWFSFFDIGLGQGLRNKFAEAKAKGNDLLVRGYISSAYFTITFISFALVVLFFICNFFIDWTKVFNTDINLARELSILMLIVFTFFCLQLIAKLITSIYIADQKPSVQGLINFLTQIVSLLIIWLLTHTSKSSLMLFGTLYSIIPVLILIVFTIISFSGRYHKYVPGIKLWNKHYTKDIFGLGIKFFIIQIAAIILYSTANMIITQLYSPDAVVPYNIAYKYFSLITMVFSIIVTPYWSAITEAYVKSDYAWIKRSMKYLLIFSVTFIMILILMILFSNEFYLLWIGDKVKIPFILSVLMSVFFMITVFIQPFVIFINGTGKIKLQLYISIITSLLNIPLSIFFARNLNLGISGVILATIVCSIPGIFYFPLQYSKLINNKAKGIWNS